MDPELKAYLEGMFQNLTQQIAETREHAEQLNRESRKHTERLNRETRVLVEDVRHQVQLVAKGVLTVNEKLDRFHDDVEAKILKLDRRVMRLEANRGSTS